MKAHVNPTRDLVIAWPHPYIRMKSLPYLPHLYPHKLLDKVSNLSLVYDTPLGIAPLLGPCLE